MLQEKCFTTQNQTLNPGNFPLTGSNESNKASYFALSADVTAQL